jgi:hypothetical protein
MHRDSLAGLSGRTGADLEINVLHNPDDVVTSLPSGPACSDGMSTPCPLGRGA